MRKKPQEEPCFPQLLSDLNTHFSSQDVSHAQPIPDDCPVHVKHPSNKTLRWLVSPLIVREEHACVHRPALIRPVNRMDGLVGTSLKPIRCTERETAFLSSVMLYVTMAVQEYRDALCWAPCVQLTLPSLSSPSVHIRHPPSCLSLLRRVYTPT